MTEYQITPKGLIIGKPLRGYRGLMTSVPGPWLLEARDLPQSRPSKVKPTPQPERASMKRRKHPK